MNWTTSTAGWGDPEKVVVRKTFCDEAMDRARKVPSPSRYEDKRPKSIRNGKISKSKEGGYISEAEYKGFSVPGPSEYTPDPSCILKGTGSSVKMQMPSKGLQ